MALQLYPTSVSTTSVLANVEFDCNGSSQDFDVSPYLAYGDIGSVYLETTTVKTGITFAAGVSSATTGLTAGALKGARVIHNGVFRGLVTDNTTTTVTITDTNYDAESVSSDMVICQFSRLTETTHYTIATNTTVIHTIATYAATQRIHVLPRYPVDLTFGAAVDTLKENSRAVYLRRDNSVYSYDTLRAFSQDKSVPLTVSNTFAQAGVTFTAGVSNAVFTGLTVNGLIGLAVVHNGEYRGKITENTATVITISDVAYTEATEFIAEIFPVGSAEFSLDNVTYAPVINLDPITTDAAVPIYVKDTVVVTSSPLNYPNIAIKVIGVEYII